MLNNEEIDAEVEWIPCWLEWCTCRCIW